MRGSKWALGFVMMVLGLLLTTQFRVNRQAPINTTRARADELATMLKEREEALKAAEAERARLAAEIESLRKTTALPTAKPEVSHEQLMAGTVAVQGQGVVVTMTEMPETKARLSDEDLWRVINELLMAGAEALAVNGERITATTGIRNVAQRIMVNLTPIAPPVEVVAIGDAKVLEASILLRGGVAEVMSSWGIKVTVHKVDNIRVPGVRRLPAFLYAKPVK